MFCKNCGTENVDGAKFCRACGAPQEQAAPAANQGYAPNQGYVPNRAPVRKNNAAGKTDIMKLIPTIAGVGTVITAFFMGPLIQFFCDRVAIPLLEKKD